MSVMKRGEAWKRRDGKVEPGGEGYVSGGTPKPAEDDQIELPDAFRQGPMFGTL